MLGDVVLALGLAVLFTAAAWLVARWLLRSTVPLSDAQARRRPIILRWYFGFAFVVVFAGVLWGLRAP